MAAVTNGQLRVGITGASGRVGSILVTELPKHGIEVTPFKFDITTGEGLDLSKTDVQSLSQLFAGLDAVIHLAANPSPFAEWGELKIHNIDASYNVFEAARLAKVRRIVFASTNHTQHGLSVADFAAPETLRKDHPLITLRDYFVPSSLYGASKAMCEVLGSYAAARYGLEFVALRIGWVGEEHLPTQEERDYYLKSLIGTSAEDYMRAIFLSRDDCVQVFHRALRFDLSNTNPPFVAAYATSNNTNPLFDSAEGNAILGYEPKDNAELRFATAAVLPSKE
eukprot:TRINITY_DN7495_c0_g1_i1.p1 TRINITY_DN7495_c0_g1~~TRINITY_DN7495_c0_g1_i1.p1  ORF type:complete len:281 (-),score=59.69 TRINITY_DN7495_c0_g1_i1:85-927(-)